MAKKLKVIAASVPTLIALNVTLFVIVLVLAGLYVQEKNRPMVEMTDSTPRVSLGVYDYEFNDGKAVKVSSETTDKLQSTLVGLAEKDISLGCASATYQVQVMDEAKTQALVKYGCDGPTAQLHTKLVDGDWQVISPTNQFDTLGIPLCDYASQHELSSAVAPVCYQLADEQAVYSAR